jgi:diguanylate cyclase (GGDEF)-like protein
MAEPLTAGGPEPETEVRATGAEPDGDHRELLAALWERHHHTNMGRVELLERAALALLDGELPPTLADEARGAAHKLAGSLGTFGFHEGTRTARTAEALLDSDQPDAKVLSECVVVLLELLGPSDDSSRTDGDTRQPDLDSTTSRPLGEPNSLPRPAVEGDQTLLLTGDPELLDRLQVAAAARRRSLLVSRDSTDAQAVLSSGGVKAVIVDLEPGPDREATLEQLRRDRPELRLFVLSATEDFEARVRAARAGGDAFLPRATPGPRLLDVVNDPVWAAPSGSATIVALDDDQRQLDLLARLLAGSRFDLVATTEAAELWDNLERESPAAVVLRLRMPEVDGLVMCRTIRAEPRWRQLPILFVADPDDDVLVQSIFAAGADDYLRTPLEAAELCARLSNHIARHDLHVAMAGTDPLTGVANRRRSEERLSQLLRLASRRAEPVSLALVHVDGVTRINRRAGHGTGDTIFRAVAGLLEEQVRDEDVIGRWGSERFVLGLYGAEADQAVERFVRLVDELAGQRFTDVAGKDLVATFSVGVAEFPADGTDLPALLGAADRALQQTIGSPGTVRSAHSLDESNTSLAQADVVVVDDDQVLADLLIHSLETAGYAVRHISDGIEAADVLGGGLLRARLVLLDVGLPGMDGFSILRVLRDRRLLDTTSVMMLTARSATPETLNALELGAIDFVGKPFNVPVLMERIENILDRTS